MAIESSCSGCGKQLSVADEHAGKQARCPACGQIYTVAFPTGSFDSGPPPAPNKPSDLFADTSAGDSAGTSPLNPSAAAAQFWMKAPDGNVYGPVDRDNLTRWFQEGRVGPQYTIRQGESGEWQVADVFRPTGASTSGSAPRPSSYGSSGNPYAPAGGQLYRYPKSDQSTVVLILGILGFFFCPCAIAAWIIGNGALRDINTGLADPTNKGMVQVGYYLGITSVVMSVLCAGGYFVLVAIVAVSGANF